MEKRNDMQNRVIDLLKGLSIDVVEMNFNIFGYEQEHGLDGSFHECYKIAFLNGKRLEIRVEVN